jgi:hypothetical protein
MEYIGNTQQHPKKRMQGHAQDVRRMVIAGVQSDSFARHFCQFVPAPKDSKDKIKVQDHIKYKFEIVWKGNAISTVKTFGSRSCKLCTQERLEILKATHRNKQKSINSRNEIYGACRHKPKFHRYGRQSTASTDESIADERVQRPSSTSSSSTTSSLSSKFDDGDPPTPTSQDEILGDPSVAPATDEVRSSAADSTEGSFSDLELVDEAGG